MRWKGFHVRTLSRLIRIFSSVSDRSIQVIDDESVIKLSEQLIRNYVILERFPLTSKSCLEVRSLSKAGKMEWK